MEYVPGTRTMTSPGVLGTSSGSGVLYPVRVYFVSLIAAATAGTLTLYNGSAASGIKMLYLTALANSTDTNEVGYGLLFTSGCYVDFTTGSMNVAIQYHIEPS